MHPGAADLFLPEARLLDQANLRAYWRKGDHEERAIVAAWPVGGTVDGFHVVVVTARPSWLNSLSKGLD